jgi:nicotinamidase-related amidase
MLNDFLAEWPKIQKQRLMSLIDYLIGMMRQHHHPLFGSGRNSSLISETRGTDGCSIVSGFDVATSNLVIVKKRYSAFFKTDLQHVLQRLMPDGLVVGGNQHSRVLAESGH